MNNSFSRLQKNFGSGGETLSILFHNRVIFFTARVKDMQRKFN